MANKDFVIKNGVQIGGAFVEKVGTVTGNATPDLSTGNVFSVTPTADVTFVFSNPPAAGDAQAFSVAVTGAFIDNSYDLANAQPPVYGRFSVFAQESSPEGVFFKPDGLKMYVSGAGGDAVYEYNLSTAWDITSVSYVQNFSVAAQDSLPSGLFFKSDGTKMYIVGLTNVAVYEYNLSTPWNISSASYVQNFSVASQDTIPRGVFFKPDGLKMYVSGTVGDSVYEYNLSTAWDISSASYVQSALVSSQDLAPEDVSFSEDGTKMYIVGDQNNSVFRYELSTAWDISSATYNNVSISVGTQETSPNGVFLKPDGTKMYIVGASQDAVYSYTLTTAWDVSTASFDFPTEGSFSVAAQEVTPSNLTFKDDGTKLYLIGTTGDDINEYSLSTAWDISTASFLQNFSVAAQDTNPQGLFFKPDGTKMYVVGSINDAVYEYNLSTAWDISTASFLQNFSVAAQDTAPQAIFFKPDGLKMYVTGNIGDAVYEYNLSTAWDISTASFVQNFSVAAQDTIPNGIFFKPDGLKMYVLGASVVGVNEYDLSTAWDISTASHVRIFSVAAEERTPTGLFFGDNGTKMYIVGVASDTIWQYSTGTYGPATITYPASVQWSGGTAPASPADGETDLLTFYTDDGGNTYYGFKVGDALA